MLVAVRALASPAAAVFQKVQQREAPTDPIMSQSLNFEDPQMGKRTCRKLFTGASSSALSSSGTGRDCPSFRIQMQEWTDLQAWTCK